LGEVGVFGVNSDKPGRFKTRREKMTEISQQRGGQIATTKD